MTRSFASGCSPSRASSMRFVQIILHTSFFTSYQSCKLLRAMRKTICGSEAEIFATIMDRWAVSREDFVKVKLNVFDNSRYWLEAVLPWAVLNAHGAADHWVSSRCKGDNLFKVITCIWYSVWHWQKEQVLRMCWAIGKHPVREWKTTPRSTSRQTRASFTPEGYSPCLSCEF